MTDSLDTQAHLLAEPWVGRVAPANIDTIPEPG